MIEYSHALILLNMTYNTSVKLVRAHYGDAFNMDMFQEGRDYVWRGTANNGRRAMFREGFMDDVKEGRFEPVLVTQQHSNTSTQQHSNAATQQEIPSSLDQVGDLASVVTSGSGVYECKVTRKYPNTRYVETDLGRVFAGGKGVLLKTNQIICAKDGVLVSVKPFKRV